MLVQARLGLRRPVLNFVIRSANLVGIVLSLLGDCGPAWPLRTEFKHFALNFTNNKICMLLHLGFDFSPSKVDCSEPNCFFCSCQVDHQLTHVSMSPRGQNFRFSGRGRRTSMNSVQVPTVPRMYTVCSVQNFAKFRGP
jgi:hypothetical protein